jgi:hypothetical protein
MKLNKGLVLGAAAMTLVGGSVLAAGAISWSQEAETDEVGSLDSANLVGAEQATAGSTTDEGVEQYRAVGGHAGGGHVGGGAHFGGGGHFGGGHVGGGRFGGHGWGRSFGWGGRGWGRGWGYRGGRWGYWGPSYYGYTCADGWYYCY